MGQAETDREEKQVTVIYEATEDRPHFCTTANASLPVGSICRCDCGRFWLRKTVIGDYWVYRWVPDAGN